MEKAYYISQGALIFLQKAPVETTEYKPSKPIVCRLPFSVSQKLIVSSACLLHGSVSNDSIPLHNNRA